MKVMCFGLIVLLIAAIAYIWLVKNSPCGETDTIVFGCGLLAFLGGGLALVGLEGICA